MWCTLSLCLFSLILTSECVNGERVERQQLLHKDSEVKTGSKEQRMPLCTHDEVCIKDGSYTKV